MRVVTVKFKDGGKPYYFAPGKDAYEKGMGVVVETAKGLEYATVVSPETEVGDDEIVSPLKPVVRIATPRDEEVVRRNIERRGEAMKTAQEKIAARGLEMKLVDCEFAFDGSKVIFSFTSESRVDFRELIKDLSSAFHMRIELRQISIRDEIKITGGLGACGRECCCVRSIAEPMKVSVKMAKNQGLSLNPSKISGLCGRLMCCLSYENEYYSEACKQVPKVGSEVETSKGKGTVVNVNMLKMQVKVKIEQGDAISYHDFGVDEIRFMRGNVVMGRESFDEPEEQPDGEIVQPAGERRDNPPERRERGNGNDRREKGNNNRSDRHDRGGKNNRGDRSDRENREEKQGGGNAEKQNGERRDNRGGKPNKHGNGNDGKERGGRHDRDRGNGNGGKPRPEAGTEGDTNPNPNQNQGGGHRGSRRKKHRGNGGKPNGLNGGGNPQE